MASNMPLAFPSGDTVLQRLEWLASHRGSEVGLVAPDGPITFSEWLDEARVVAAGLVELGIRPGDCVGIVLGNAQGRAFTTTLTGAQLLGALAVPLNPRTGVLELKTIQAATGTAVWFVAESARERLEKALQDGMKTQLVCVGGAARLPAEAVAFDEFVRAAGTVPPPTFAATPETPCTLAYTSGTTGAPKGVLWSHELLTMCAELMVEVFGERYTGAAMTESDAMQSAVPIFTGVMMANFLNVTMYTGCQLVLEDRFEPGDAENLISRWGTTIYFGVPSIFALWKDSRARVDDRLRCLATGGARIPPDLIDAMRERWPQATLLNLYGTVEAGAAMIVNAGDEMVRFPTAIGRPVPPTEVAIRGENGNVAPGETGTLFIRSPGMMLGYRGDQAATDGVLKDGWLETPDVATMTEDGLIYLYGRTKETINRGGYKILPNEVEEALELHSDVEEAGVVSIPHPILGHDVAAGVVLKEGCSFTVDELRDFVGGLLADYKVPRTIRFLPRLPRNHHGKLDRPELQRQLDT